MNTFLTKISEFFSKDILFASLLPGLLFLVTISAVLVYIVGPVNALVLYGEQSTNSALLIAFLSTLVLIVVAYVLHSVRDIILAFWCGRSFIHKIFLQNMKQAYQNTFDVLDAQSKEIGDWMFEIDEFNKKFEAAEPEGLPDIPPDSRNRLMEWIGSLPVTPSQEQKYQILTAMKDAYRSYNQASMLVVRQRFNAWDLKYRAEDAFSAMWLDIQFGSTYTIQATELGNIVQAYNEYSSKRYQMEAAVFWPRLQKVMDEKYLDKVADQRISLDFAVTCAMLSLSLFLIGLCGPLFHTNFLFWLIFCGVSFVLTLLSYRLAVDAAYTLGHLVRSSYDLYRLKLLKALNLKWPKDTDEEKATWLKFSQTVSYGYSGVLELTEEGV